MAKNFFKRYIWLVDLINRRKYVSFKEISEAWMRSPLNETGDPLSERTFFNHKDAIAGMFGMKVIYYSTSGTSHCKLYPSVSLDELLESSDVVSIHAPLNERTRSLIGQAQLAKMKKSALLLNLGRGGIVDEEALAFAVDNGVIAGAALDVFEKEPLPATSPLLHLRHPERFRFSPHTAWASREALARLVSKVADNIRNFYGLQA